MDIDTFDTGLIETADQLRARAEEASEWAAYQARTCAECGEPSRALIRAAHRADKAWSEYEAVESQIKAHYGKA